MPKQISKLLLAGGILLYGTAALADMVIGPRPTHKPTRDFMLARQLESALKEGVEERRKCEVWIAALDSLVKRSSGKSPAEILRLLESAPRHDRSALEVARLKSEGAILPAGKNIPGSEKDDALPVRYCGTLTKLEILKKLSLWSPPMESAETARFRERVDEYIRDQTSPNLDIAGPLAAIALLTHLDQKKIRPLGDSVRNELSALESDARNSRAKFLERRSSGKMEMTAVLQHEETETAALQTRLLNLWNTIGFPDATRRK